MNANRENLEALLCAFIDDELSAEQRQIIEQHLAANPRDLKLMAELARTRQLLRDLPRQTAPPDLAEALQVQLERRSLLDGDEFVGRPVRMTIMPRVWSIAALVVVAVGMGIVIHSVLPPTGRFAPQTLVRATVAVSDRELAKDGPTPMTEIGTALTLRDHAEGKKEDGAFNASALTATALPTSGRSGRPEITETRAMATGKDAGGDYTRVAEKSTGYFLWSAGTAGAQHKPQSTDNNSVAPTPVVVIVNTQNTLSPPQTLLRTIQHY